MGKYTFEQIINERMREYDELKKEAAKFNDLVTYDKKYEGTGNFYFADRNDLAFYYTYASEPMKKLKKMYKMMPFAIHGRDVLIINGDDQVKKEYNDYKNKPLLTIDNIEAFKESFDSLARSPLVKEIVSLDNESTHKINSSDGKTQLKLTNNCVYVQQDSFEIDFWYEDYFGLHGDSLTAPQILEMFKASTFDSNSFSEFFSERIEMNKGKDLSIEISDDYTSIPFIIDKDGESTSEYFDTQKREDVKKLILTRKK